MDRATREAMDAVARLPDPERHDRFSESALHRSLEEYLARRREPVRPLILRVDGAEFPTLYAALADRGRHFERMEIGGLGPEVESYRWECLRPFERLEVSSGGPSLLYAGGQPPVRFQARFLLREHFVPMSRPAATRSPPTPVGPVARPELFDLRGLARYLRSTGIVPFALALVAYFADERIRYEIDLPEGLLLTDPRARRLPAGRRVSRSSRLAHHVDALVARGELSLPSVRALETVVESDGLSALELAPLFGGVRELGSSALDSLVARKLIVFDRRSGLYRPRLEALAEASARDRSAAREAGRRPNPRLKRNVAALIAQAESRATCPLCGASVPADHRGLLCADCQKLVGPTAGPA